MEMLPKKCLACGKPVKGRSDKKFCDDYCRNVYNNQVKGTDSSHFRNINNILKKNRNLLVSLLIPGQETTKVNRKKLSDLGFQFRYFTHQYTTKKGATYFFCYDHGYLPMEKDWLLVVKEKEPHDKELKQ
ncbi:hypothetical protein [Niabella aquatica]